MRIVVTGRHGQLARSLIEGAAGVGCELITLARPEFDLARIDHIAAAIDRLAPDLVVNAAAYTAVDQAESNADAALLINGAAAGALAAGCARRDIPIIQVSTDFVFDGTKPEAYVETDAMRPLNVYGASKMLGEQLVAAANPRHLIVRTSWVVSPFGHNFVNTMLRLAVERERLSIVDDQQGAPTYAPHLASAILALAQAMAAAPPTDPRWGTYHLTNAGETTWYGLAHATFTRAASAGVRIPKIEPIAASDYPLPARRPANSRLDCRKLQGTFAIALPPWQIGVDACVDRLLG